MKRENCTNINIKIEIFPVPILALTIYSNKLY